MKKILLLTCLLFSMLAPAQQTQQLIARGDSLFLYGNRDSALKVFESILKKEPANASVLARKSTMLFEKARFDEATKLLEAALKAEPQNSEALTVKARTAMMAGKNYDAKKILDEVISRDPKYTRAIVTRAMLQQQSGSKIGALLDYDAAVKSDTNDLTARMLRARYNSQSDYYSAAIKDYHAAVRIAPKMPDTWYERGMCYVHYEDWEHAMADMNKCLELDSLFSDALQTRGTIYLRQQKYDLALVDYRKAMKLDTTSIMLYSNMMQLYYSLEDLDNSCVYCFRMKDLAVKQKNKDALNEAEMQAGDFCDSAQASYYYQRGISLFNQGRYEESLLWHNRGLAKFPGNTAITQFRGNTYLAMENFQAALTDYESALKDPKKLIADYRTNVRFSIVPETDPTFAILGPNLHMLRAEILSHLGNQGEALNEINMALAAMPGNLPAGLGIDEQCIAIRGLIENKLGKKEDALLSTGSIITRNPNNPFAHYVRALLLLQNTYVQKDKSSSLEIGFKKAELDIRYNFPLKVKKLSVTQDLQAADDDLTKAISLDSQSADAYYLRGLLRCQLGNNDGINDLLKAKELGHSKAEEALTAFRK